MAARCGVVALSLVVTAWPALGFAQTETVTYVHTDVVGSVRMLTNASGQVIARYDYAPFGEEIAPPAPPPTNTRRFAGKERDGENPCTAASPCHDYFGGRYLHGLSGRFTTVDPVLDFDQALVNPQLWNRYSYALNNPLKFTDPDGRDPMLVGGAIGAGAYAGMSRRLLKFSGGSADDYAT